MRRMEEWSINILILNFTFMVEVQAEKPRGRMVACTSMGGLVDDENSPMATVEQVRRLFEGEELDIVKREDNGFDIYRSGVK